MGATPYVPFHPYEPPDTMAKVIAALEMGRRAKEAEDRIAMAHQELQLHQQAAQREAESHDINVKHAKIILDAAKLEQQKHAHETAKAAAVEAGLPAMMATLVPSGNATRPGMAPVPGLPEQAGPAPETGEGAVPPAMPPRVIPGIEGAGVPDQTVSPTQAALTAHVQNLFGEAAKARAAQTSALATGASIRTDHDIKTGSGTIPAGTILNAADYLGLMKEGAPNFAHYPVRHTDIFGRTTESAVIYDTKTGKSPSGVQVAAPGATPSPAASGGGPKLAAAPSAWAEGDIGQQAGDLLPTGTGKAVAGAAPNKKITPEMQQMAQDAEDAFGWSKMVGTSAGGGWISPEVAKGKAQENALKVWANVNGVRVLKNKDEAATLDALENVEQKYKGFYDTLRPKLSASALTRNLGGGLLNKAAAWSQFDPQMSNYEKWKSSTGIEALQSIVARPGRGFRTTEAEINKMTNALFGIGDTRETADNGWVTFHNEAQNQRNRILGLPQGTGELRLGPDGAIYMRAP